jgi:hypothetical protein
MLTGLTGCGGVDSTTDDDNVKAKDMEALEPLTFEEIAAGNTDSADTRENTVYQYITDTVTIDTSNLVSVTDAEKLDLQAGIEEVNTALISGDTTFVDAALLNYMLWEFAATPYNWEYSDYSIKGIDAATRLYFVDVTYKTKKTEKEVIPDSLIVRGAPDEETLKAKRYSDYITWLQSETQETDGLTAWQRLVQSEWATADALSVFAFGLNYDNVLDGYTVDAKHTNKHEISKQEIDAVYGNSYVDSEGNIIASDNYTFEDRWGSLDDIFATQSGVTMVDRLVERTKNTSTNIEDAIEIPDETAENEQNDEIVTNVLEKSNNNNVDDIGVYTYSGLTEVAKNYGATMTFRLVFKYAYSIGSDNAMALQSMYLYDYKLDDTNDLIESYTTETIQNGDVLLPYIQTAIKSYRKAVEESNHQGLYNLFVTYDKYDTYFADLIEYSYVSNGGMTIDLIGRKGDEVAMVVTQRTKKRAKGTNMSMPTYQEQVLMKVKLCTDDTIRIVSLTTLDSTLIGEPLSIIRNVTGVTEQIAYDSTAFSKANQHAVEQTIAEFEKIQIEYAAPDLKSTDYDIIDLGMSTAEKTNMLKYFETVNNIKASQGAVWLTSYVTKSNVYCSVNVREVFVGETTNLDSEATIGLLNRNGTWKVISYCRTMAVRTATQGLDALSETALATIDVNTDPAITYIKVTDVTGDQGDTNVNISTDNEVWDVEQETNADKESESIEEIESSNISANTEVETQETDANLEDFF